MGITIKPSKRSVVVLSRHDLPTHVMDSILDHYKGDKILHAVMEDCYLTLTIDAGHRWATYDVWEISNYPSKATLINKGMVKRRFRFQKFVRMDNPCNEIVLSPETSVVLKVNDGDND